jgi:hypothetical protein
MTSAALENLLKIRKLKAEPTSFREFDVMTPHTRSPLCIPIMWL